VTRWFAGLRLQRPARHEGANEDAPPCRTHADRTARGRGFIPTIFDPTHGPERFPKKAKLDPESAIAYARRVLWWRQRRAADKARRLEALSHPDRAFPQTWADLAASSDATQRFLRAALLAAWQRNSDRELDADVAFDFSPERKSMWGGAR
jgi:hypothetical protein